MRKQRLIIPFMLRHFDLEVTKHTHPKELRFVPEAMLRIGAEDFHDLRLGSLKSASSVQGRNYYGKLHT